MEKTGIQKWKYFAKLAFNMSATGMISSLLAQEQHPNVIIVLADDLGYGDLECHGNPYLKTPNLNKLHDESIRFTDFHVAPMSSPTRGQLLTGVDCLHNGCMATCEGRSIVRDEYPMIGEIFSAAGYNTGMFGKWHVGTNWPHRPMDRGFQTAEYFLGFGLTDLPHYWNSDYYDPYYFKNGELNKAKGFCNDFWFSEAMNWMKENSKTGKPFLCYIPTNMAHYPEWIDSAYSKPYRSTGAAEFYGMIASIDENMGKLDQFLKKNKLSENTILIYLTDNGTVHKEVYNAGMTGGKCSSTEGGHRVPCFIKWPKGKLVKPSDIQVPAEVQDILPTLIDLCQIQKPSDAKFDGISLSPVLRGGTLDDRMFVVQYYHHDVKEYDAAIVWNNWRLLPLYGDQLYDIRTDLAQKIDVAKEHPDVVKKMKDFYVQWWTGLEPGLNDFVPNHIGNANQKEVVLYSVDWQNIRADGCETVRQPKLNHAKGGLIDMLVENAGTYIIELRRWPREAEAALNAGLPPFIPRFGKPELEGKALPIAKVHFVINGIEKDIDINGNEKNTVFEIKLDKGKSTMQAWFCDAKDDALCGAFYAYIRMK